jgi:hypothetical protein
MGPRSTRSVFRIFSVEREVVEFRANGRAPD